MIFSCELAFLSCRTGPAYAAGLLFVLPDGPSVRRWTAAGATHLHHREILFADANSNFPSFGTGKLLKVILNLNELSE